MDLSSGFVAAALVVVHVFGARLHVFSAIPRSRFLSAAGGVSVAYVFMHLLPEVAEAQDKLEEHLGGPLATAARERHAYLLCMAGLATFYGLERLTVGSRAKCAEEDRSGAKAREGRTSALAFCVSVASFSVYNLLLAYVVARSREDGVHLFAYGVAIALHFLVNDFALREHHKDVYDRIGRWVLAGAVVLGVGIGWTFHVDEVLLRAALSFLAGGIILNALKEELPSERRSRFWAFAAGAGAYTALLLVATR